MINPRRQRLIPGESPVIIVACDHGEFDGPQPGLDDPLDVVASVPDSVDAVLMSPGTLLRCGEALGHRGAPLAVVRLNWNTVYTFGWKPVDGVSAAALAPEAALQQGADAALVSLTLQTGSEARDAANVQLASELIQGCRACGMPVIGEYFPLRTDERDSDDLRDEVTRGSRIIAELGADAVKTFLLPEWDQVARTTPIPLFALGAQLEGTDEDSLTLARQQLDAGARGLVYGRRAFQAEDPQRFMADLARLQIPAGVGAA